MHCGRSAQYGNSFLGTFGCSTDRLTFIGNPQDKVSDACRRFLKTEVVNLTVNGSNLAGIFMAANSNGAVFPEFALKEEVKVAEKAGLNSLVVKGRHSAIGNNIATNDRIALVNPEIGKENAKLIGECLGVEVVQREVAGYKTVGSACVLTNKGFLLHSKAARELEEFETILGLKGGIGTANMGVPFVGRCLLANSNGYVTGEETSGFEMHRIDEALGFIGR